ncbi:MAG: YraN family protein [Acidimicrobiia bacterium]
MHERSLLGRRGEDAAAGFYESNGFTVLDRNWHGPEGELDLVLSRGRLVVFCEVKTRRNTAFGTPADAVTAVKQQKLRTTALRWIQEHRGRYETRFDVAAVLMDGDDARVELITNAF